MLEFIAIFDRDGEEVSRINIHAENLAAAYTDESACTMDGETVTVYPATNTPSGLYIAAAYVAHNVAECATGKTGKGAKGADLDAVDRAAALAAARKYAERVHAATHAGAENAAQKRAAELRSMLRRMYDHIAAGRDAADLDMLTAEYSADTRDMIGEAMGALCAAAALDIVGQYAAAYAAVNDYVHRGANRGYDVSTEYLQSVGGDIVAINRVIAHICNGKPTDTYFASGHFPVKAQKYVRRAYSAFLDTLKATERETVKLLAGGYSQAQIAAATRRNERTVRERIAKIRAAAVDYFEREYPLILKIVKAEEIRAARTIHTANERRSTSNADYMRAYRARKKAEREKK